MEIEVPTSPLANTYLPSDPDFFLEYMAGIASDDNDDDFDGYLQCYRAREYILTTVWFLQILSMNLACIQF